MGRNTYTVHDIAEDGSIGPAWYSTGNRRQAEKVARMAAASLRSADWQHGLRAVDVMADDSTVVSFDARSCLRVAA